MNGKTRTSAGIEITTWKWLRAMVEYEAHHRGQRYLTLGLMGLMTPPIPLVVVGALGKLCFFVLFVACWAAGDLPARSVAQATPDLVLAVIFLWWASVQAQSRPAFA